MSHRGPSTNAERPRNGCLPAPAGVASPRLCTTFASLTPCHPSPLAFVASEPDDDMRASDCRRRFVMLAEGGVKVLWECGDEIVARSETLCDVYTLDSQYPVEWHSHRRLGRRRKG